MSKIYIAPKTNSSFPQYTGKLLVFDHVESMTHSSTASIAAHPVEFQNSNIADHRYHLGTEITITGNISDNWQTDLVTNPTPVFQTIGWKNQKQLRAACGTELGTDSPTCQLVNNILDGNDASQAELIRIPSDELSWVTEATRLVITEQDTAELAEEKGMSISKDEDNASVDNSNINRIIQAMEMLEYIDNHNLIVKVHSLKKVYDNMVLTSFTNPLRNGPERGAYWVTLTFRELRLAQTASDIHVAAVDHSEFLKGSKNLGKGKKNELDETQTKAADVAINKAIDNIRQGNTIDGAPGGINGPVPNITGILDQKDSKGVPYLVGIKEKSYSVYFPRRGDEKIASQDAENQAYQNITNILISKGL